MNFSPPINELRRKIFSVTPREFENTAVEIFRYQYQHNEVYRHYADLLHKNPGNVTQLHHIPFLPVSFFKTHKVLANVHAEYVFETSATTSQTPGRHYIADLSLYEESFLKCFEMFFGASGQYCMLMLLPSYLERKHSSLVYMAEKLIQKSGHPLSSFYLYDYEKLNNTIAQLEQQQQPYILLGVSFALLQFSNHITSAVKHGTIIETGGMKGRGREIVRAELHHLLKEKFGVPAICSEYGMTELLSQAYMKAEGTFRCPPWMKVLIRDAYNPFSMLPPQMQGGINIIDLANLHSCSFIETGDIGMAYPDGSFGVAGRLDHSEIRGCNLLVN
jgi:phenylacetate-coenzyme A ligase PaaK-like adenylate-forming protein